MFAKRNEGLVKLSIIFSSTMSNYIKKKTCIKKTSKTNIQTKTLILLPVFLNPAAQLVLG